MNCTRVAVIAVVMVAAVLLSATTALAAEGVGEVIAVTPAASASSQVGERTLAVGSRVFIGDVVSTDATGEVQLLFDDGTWMVVGPNSSLGIDEFNLGDEFNKERVTLSLLEGTVRVIAGGGSAEFKYTYRTEWATVIPLEGQTVQEGSIRNAIDEMATLESDFVALGKTGDSSVEVTFRSNLLTNIQSPERRLHRSATYAANLYFGDSEAMLADLVALLETDEFQALSPPARNNVMYLITETAESAWTPALADRAREEVARIATDPSGEWLDQRHTGFAKLEERIASLPLGEAASWSFGTIQERDAETKSLTDVDVFVCMNATEDKEFVTKALETALRLVELDFGRVRLHRWPETDATATPDPPVSELSGFSTVFVDKGHPESNEVARVEKAVLGIDGLPSFRVLANEGRTSPWYLSLFLCPPPS